MATYKIGTGSGALSVKSMGTYQAGDILDIVPGAYSSASFGNLARIFVTASGGKVSFASSISLDKNNGLQFDATNFTLPVNSSGFVPVSNNRNISIVKGDFSANPNTPSVVDGSGNKITYKGTDDTTLFTNLTLDNIKVKGKTMLYNGTWADALTLGNVVKGLVMTNITVVNDGTGSCQKVFGISIYNMIADTWSISGPTIQNNGDIGIFQTVGNGTLKNINRNGGWGYLWRVTRWLSLPGEKCPRCQYGLLWGCGFPLRSCYHWDRGGCEDHRL